MYSAYGHYLLASLLPCSGAGRWWFSAVQREKAGTWPKVTSLPGAKARLTLGVPGSEIGPLPPPRRLLLCLGSVCWLLTRGKRCGWLRELPLLPQVCEFRVRGHTPTRKEGGGPGSRAAACQWERRRGLVVGCRGKRTRQVGDGCAGLGSRRLRYHGRCREFLRRVVSRGHTPSNPCRLHSNSCLT